MGTFRVHFIHVGNMNNKGTQALFSSDVFVMKEIVAGSSISVSTTDIPGVKRLHLPVANVLPPMLDLPYDKADQICKNLGRGRSGVYYKALIAAILLLMPVQVALSLLSVTMGKLGFRSVYRNGVIEQVKHSDLVISHSDENFKETASSIPLNPYWAVTWWTMLLTRTFEVMVARSLGKPVVLFPNSVGPFRTWIGRFLARLSLNSCDYLLIRDPISYDIVNNLGVQTSRILTYDTALLFNSTKAVQSLNEFSRPVIGVSAGVPSNSLSDSEVQNYITSHAEALDAAVNKYDCSVAFLPHYISGFRNDDVDISGFILERMKNKSQAAVVKTDSVDEFKSLLNQMDLVVSSKMHPAILATSGYVPVLCIVYDHKQTGFFQRLDMEEFTLDITEVSPELLTYKMHKAWTKKDSLRESLRLQIPQWQRNVKANIGKIVMHYVNGEKV